MCPRGRGGPGPIGPGRVAALASRGVEGRCPSIVRKNIDAPALGASRAGPPFPYLRWSGPRREVGGAAMDAVVPPRCLGCARCPTWPAASTTSPRPTSVGRPRYDADAIDAIAAAAGGGPAAARRRRRDRAALRPAAGAGLRRRRRRAAGRDARHPGAARSAPERALAGTRRGAAAARRERRRRRVQRRLALVRRRPRGRRAGARRAARRRRGRVRHATRAGTAATTRPTGGSTSRVVHTALPKADHPALVSGWRRARRASRVIRPSRRCETREESFVHHTDRDGIVAHWASMSFVAALPDGSAHRVPRRSSTRMLARRGVEAVDDPVPGQAVDHSAAAMNASAPPRCLGCGDVRTGPQLRRRRRRLRARPPALRRRTRSSRSPPQAGGGPAAARRRRRAPGACPARCCEKGFDVVAVEPLDGMRAILARTHRRRPRAGGPRRGAAAPRRERRRRGLQRRLALVRRRPRGRRARAASCRPGGGVVVCVTHLRWFGSDDAPDVGGWTSRRRPRSAAEGRPTTPTVTGSRAPRRPRGPSGLRADRGARRARSCTTPTASGIVAHWALDVVRGDARSSRPAHARSSPSSTPCSRAAASRRSTIPYRAELWITRRRPAPAPPAGRRAAAS